MIDSKIIYDISNGNMFKSVFSNKDAAKLLLKHVFNTKEEIIDIITECEVLKVIDSKKSYLDVLIKTQDNLYIVEMQNKGYENIYQRMFYYCTSLASTLLKEGTDYVELKKVKIVMICNFKPLDVKEFRHKIKLTSRINYNLCFDFLNVEFINLLNVEEYKTKEEKNFFNCFKGIYSKSKEIDMIKNYVNIYNSDEEWMKMNREKLSLYHTAYEVGLYEGKIEGKLEGKLEEKHISLRNLLKTFKKIGVSKSDACVYAKDTIELSKEDINKALEEIYN